VKIYKLLSDTKWKRKRTDKLGGIQHMANYNQAPTLHHNGDKECGTNFYKIPQELADIVFQELGNASAQLRIMLVLIGTKPETFNISDKWICERTGLLHPSYINARKALVNRGWLSHDPAKGITVNFDVIYGKNRGNTILQNENQCSNTTLPQRGNTILPHRSNTILPQCSNTILPIIDNTDNNTDKIIDSEDFSQEYKKVSKREMLALGVPYEVVDESQGLYRILATNKIVKAI
jgi:hypothetical protein